MFRIFKILCWNEIKYNCNFKYLSMIIKVLIVSFVVLGIENMIFFVVVYFKIFYCISDRYIDIFFRW